MKPDDSLYNDLVALTKYEDSPFYMKTVNVSHKGAFLRATDNIFLYRMASYTDFCRPNALEARGIMFRMTEDPNGTHIDVVSRPPTKFHNYMENPFTEYTMEWIEEHTTLVMDKADGSLISTYLDIDDKIKLKTKGSLESVQAVDAMAYLAKRFYLFCMIEGYVLNGYTVNMEWTSPTNRIVLGYQEPKLIILNVRNNVTGEYVPFNRVQMDFSHHCVEKVDNSVLKDYREQEGIEGYVAQMDTGQYIKFKTDWYVSLHRNKENVNTPRRLYESCLDEVTDDLRGLFTDDEAALALIEDMEEKVKRWHNDLIKGVEGFYNVYHYLDRKDFAMKAQRDLTNFQFGLTMMLYSGKIPAYKEMMKKHYKLYLGE